jgi:hypothetical protein
MQSLMGILQSVFHRAKAGWDPGAGRIQMVAYPTRLLIPCDGSQLTSESPSARR